MVASSLVATSRRAASYRGGGGAHPLIGEGQVEPHDHRVGVAVDHDLDAPVLERLTYPRPPDQQRPLARLQQPGRRHRRGHHVAVSVDPDWRASLASTSITELTE